MSSPKVYRARPQRQRLQRPRLRAVRTVSHKGIDNEHRNSNLGLSVAQTVKYALLALAALAQNKDVLELRRIEVERTKAERPAARRVVGQPVRSSAATRARSSVVFTSELGGSEVVATRISKPFSSARSCSSLSAVSSGVGASAARRSRARTR